MIFLDTPEFLRHGADWILGQIGIVIVLVLVLLSIKAWMNKEYMTVFTSLIIGGIIAVFAFAGEDAIEKMGKLLLGIFKLDDEIS